MKVTIKEKGAGPSFLIKKNDEVVAGTGITTPDAQPVEAPVEAPAEEAKDEGVKKVE